MRHDSGLPVGELVAGGSALPPRRVALHGPRLSLRPVEAAVEAGHLFACSHGTPAREALWTYMAYGPFPDPATMRDWLVARAASADPLFYTVLWGGERPAGMVALQRMSLEHRSIEIAHVWYDPALQGNGINSEVVELLATEAFGLGYRRLEWKCDALNARSRAAARGLGFAFEGVFRQHMIVKGRSRDTAWFAMVADDWPAVRAHLAQRRQAQSESAR